MEKRLKKLEFNQETLKILAQPTRNMFVNTDGGPDGPVFPPPSNPNPGPGVCTPDMTASHFAPCPTQFN